jgi:hypothetical protein
MIIDCFAAGVAKSRIPDIQVKKGADNRAEQQQ